MFSLLCNKEEKKSMFFREIYVLKYLGVHTHGMIGFLTASA